jgi:hypothetical protein
MDEARTAAVNPARRAASSVAARCTRRRWHVSRAAAPPGWTRGTVNVSASAARWAVAASARPRHRCASSAARSNLATVVTLISQRHAWSACRACRDPSPDRCALACMVAFDLRCRPVPADYHGRPHAAGRRRRPAGLAARSLHRWHRLAAIIPGAGNVVSSAMGHDI